MPSSVASINTTDRRARDTREFFALQVNPGASLEQIADQLGARHEGQIGELKHHHKFSVPRGSSAIHALSSERKSSRGLENAHRSHIQTRDALGGIIWSQKLFPKAHIQKRRPPPLLHLNTSGWMEDADAVQSRNDLMSRLEISDPQFKYQWHLFNTYQAGQDMNVTGLWLEGVTGKGVVTAFIDDGLDSRSLDLKGNFFAAGSYDFNDRSEIPQPRLSTDLHGTRCAGEVAAENNGICGLGIAYESKVAGIRLLSGPIDESDEAVAINYRFQENHIYSCSWGPPDNGDVMSGPGLLFQRAMMNGVQKGRDGKGSIYVFASGNGGWLGDNCNFDGYTNSIYTVTIGAITREGKHPEYSEPCAAQLAVAYSSAGYQSTGMDAISTTDVGLNTCAHDFGGTSAAGPLAAGTLALALSVRPELTWRDVQYLLRETAVPIDGADGGEWQISNTGQRFSHIFGFGKIDAYALVQMAKNWPLVKPQAWHHSPWLQADEPIPQGPLGLVSMFSITQNALQHSNLERLEHVTVSINVNHTRRGDLSVELHSPSGIISYLSTEREKDDVEAGYDDWTFMTVAHWGERGIGTWQLVVRDNQVNRFCGTFISWKLNLWGEAIDGETQELHPFPTADHGSEEVLQVGAQPASLEMLFGQTAKVVGHVPGNSPASHLADIHSIGWHSSAAWPLISILSTMMILSLVLAFARSCMPKGNGKSLGDQCREDMTCNEKDEERALINGGQAEREKLSRSGIPGP